VLLLAGCSRKEELLNELHIEAAEVGPVPASTVPNLPAAEDVVVFSHGPGPTSTAVYRHTVACPFRMINSMSGMKVLKDRIQLCFEPLEASSPEAVPLSACPYELAVKYEMFGVPADVNPRFEIVGDCSGMPR
jgi:hypothetical protein